MTRAARPSRSPEEIGGAEDTRAKLLSMAATLFGKAGYHAVSLREISAAAGVNMALIGYHFGSKEALFKAAYRIDAEPVTSGRRRRIERLLAEPPELARVIDAWIAPVFEQATEGSRHAFMRLSGILGDEKLPFLDELVLATHGPVNALFLDALQRCLPGLSRETLMMRLAYLVGMLSPAVNPLPASMTGVGTPARRGTLDSRRQQIAAFALAGFLAPEPEPF